MLKSYNELSRWYSALEPETDTDAPARRDTTEGAGDEEPSAPVADATDRRDVSESRADGVIEPFTPKKAEPSSLALDFEPTPTADPRGRDIELPAEHEKRPTPVEPEPVPPPPAELAARRRSDYTGGWSDWVAEPAPGPDDDYDAELVQFPWPESVHDDYDAAHVLAPSGSLRAARRGQRTWLVLAVAVLVLVLVATGVVFLLFGRGDDTAEPADAALRLAMGNVVADTTGACPTERTATVVRSAEPGGTQSGPDAVLAFQHAYYVTRSADLARAVVAADAAVSPAAVIQRGIDSIPVGTTHCVRITTVAPDRFTVEITEFRPAGAPATYTKQTVRTALVGDRTLITGIAAG